MSKTEVLLIQPVSNLGNEGDVVSVALGYARNFLIPEKKALPVTHANKKRIEALLQAREQRLMNEYSEAEVLANKIQKLSIAIAVKTGDNGRMFGAVTAQHVLEKILESGIAIDKKAVSLSAPIKVLGKQTARIKLHSKVVFEISFEVVSENPIQA